MSAVATAPKHETTQSDAYEVSAEMIRERIGCTKKTLCEYQNRGLIKRGKRREGVRGIFFTVDQANRLLARLPKPAPKFEERS